MREKWGGLRFEVWNAIADDTEDGEERRALELTMMKKDMNMAGEMISTMWAFGVTATALRESWC